MEILNLEKYYRNVINHMPGAMIIFGVDQEMLHVRYVSDNCVKISGFTPEETYERALISPIADAHPEDRSQFLNHDWNFGKETLSFTYRIICKNGKYKWVHLALSRVEEEGEILYYGLFSDVDEEYKREEEERKKEEQIKRQMQMLQDMYQSILDETGAMITVIDAKTYEVVYANKTAIDSSKVEGYIGCTCYKGIHKVSQPCTGCLLSADNPVGTEMKEVTYAGRTYRMIKKLFLWNQRRALLEYSEDITERRKLQKIEVDLEAAKQANQAKTEFLSRVSHDMRTPLNGILGLTAIMKENAEDDSLRRDLTELEMSGKYLLDLINDTLDVSRIESGKMELHPTVFDGRTLFNNMVRLAKTCIQGKNLKFTVHAENIPFTILYVDVGRIEQIVMNVFGNAVKFTPEGGSIDVTMKNIAVEEQMITDQIIIKDSGVGMTAEFIPHIFEAFSQEDASNTSNTQGTGLGMAITKKLITLMGGDIAVESELGKGSCFTITLKCPVATEEQIENWKKSRSYLESGQSFAGKRILLCEDHPLNTKIALKLLETKGIVVEHAANGKIGVEMYEQSPSFYYDAILMDIRMPIMDGLKAANTIRALSRRDAVTVPIIAMTANAFEEDIRKAKEAGMTGHISKPIQTEILYQTLAEQMHTNDQDQKQKVLVVDDIDVNRSVIRESLVGDYEIFEAQNGREAMDIIESTKGIEVVITDIQMPEMDGVDLIRRIRSDKKYQHVVIIANTQFGDPEQEEMLLALGANDFVYKPTTPKIIEIRVRNALRRI